MHYNSVYLFSTRVIHFWFVFTTEFIWTNGKKKIYHEKYVDRELCWRLLPTECGKHCCIELQRSTIRKKKRVEFHFEYERWDGDKRGWMQIKRVNGNNRDSLGHCSSLHGLLTEHTLEKSLSLDRKIEKNNTSACKPK